MVARLNQNWPEILCQKRCTGGWMARGHVCVCAWAYLDAFFLLWQVALVVSDGAKR